MAEQAVETPVKATVFFERKVQVREYESAVAGIHVQADIDLADDALAINQKVKDAFFQAKAAVFEQLGIEFSIDDNGVIMETLKKHFGSVTEAGPAEVAAASAPAAAPSGAPNLKNGQVAHDCQPCGRTTAHWDNRPKKKSGEYKPKSPDLKCATQGCGKGVWL